jgi:hypothetical protein
MEEKMRIGYENTDKKIEIEIYGLKFEIKNVEKIKDYENVEDDDLNGLEKMIETLLGENSINKLNEQRKKDGYDKIDSAVALNLLVGISQTYTNEYTNNIMQPLEKTVDRINNFNRKARRYNNKNRGRYGRY